MQGGFGVKLDKGDLLPCVAIALGVVFGLVSLIPPKKPVEVADRTPQGLFYYSTNSGLSTNFTTVFATAAGGNSRWIKHFDGDGVEHGRWPKEKPDDLDLFIKLKQAEYEEDGRRLDLIRKQLDEALKIQNILKRPSIGQDIDPGGFFDVNQIRPTTNALGVYYGPLNTSTNITIIKGPK